MVEDGGGQRGMAGEGRKSGKGHKTVEDGGRWRGTAGDNGDDIISSVLIAEIFLSGKLRKRRDRRT